MEKQIAFFQIAILIVATFAFAYFIADIVPIVSAEQKYCCEKTNSGGLCVFTDESNCAEGFSKSPTSCESTSYCKQGCCYDSQEGLCMESTSKKVCDQQNGIWADSKECDIPQCDLGCCILGSQAALVSLVRCKRLSLVAGLETDFRTNIKTEAACIEESLGSEQGACVYESEFQNTCKFGTRQECKTLGGTNGTTSEFYKNDLCSKEELGTICVAQASTACFDGKVYYVDSCGNKENIYSSNKQLSYNSGRVLTQEEFEAKGGCKPEEAKNNPNCGNCDYLAGSTCREYKRGKDPGKANPTEGDYFCRDLDCYDTYNGEDYKHGESWCVYDNQFDSVGSRHWRHVCVEGEELVEPCADYRAEVCIQGEVETEQGKFDEAACRANRWQQCAGIEDKDDCENTDKQDCLWISGIEGIQDVCVPNLAPGLKFWDTGDADNICQSASTICTVVYEKGFFGEKCIENCECLEASWAQKMNDLCSQKGDCGGKVNILSKWGDGYNWKVDGDKQELSESYINEKKKAGLAKDLIKSLLS